MKQKKITAAVIIVLIAALVAESAYLLVFSGEGQSGRYLPSLTIDGDVGCAAKLSSSDGKYILTCNGEETDLSAEVFEFEGAEYTGVLLSDIIAETELEAEKTHIYYVGWDGMMSSVDAASLEKNYIVFGEHGWEAMNEGYPASSNVKEMKSITAVADNPSDVPASVTVKDDSGYDRTVSPGTLLLLMDRVSSPRYHGQSEKAGKEVVVMTTDTYVQIGESRLTVQDNEIKDLSENEKIQENDNSLNAG